MAKQQIGSAGRLPTSPINIHCPYCGAKPGKDCATTSGGWSVVHILRIKAAAAAGKKILPKG